MKLTTKLLLGATLIAGLSISAFAACASDVDFGSTDGTNGKKITGLMNGSDPQDAVNYRQTLMVTSEAVAPGPDVNVTVVDLEVVKSGKTVCFRGNFRFNQTLTTHVNPVLVIPNGFRPVGGQLVGLTDAMGGTSPNLTARGWIATGGNVHYNGGETNIPSGTWIYPNACWITN